MLHITGKREVTMKNKGRFHGKAHIHDIVEARVGLLDKTTDPKVALEIGDKEVTRPRDEIM